VLRSTEVKDIYKNGYEQIPFFWQEHCCGYWWLQCPKTPSYTNWTCLYLIILQLQV